MNVDARYHEAAHRTRRELDSLPIPEFDPHQRPGHRGRSLAFSGALAAVVLLTGLLVLAAQGREPGEREPGGTELAEVDESVIEGGVAGPRDGLDTVGLPVVADPSQGLVDGQTITLSGSGFPPHADVGIVMCSPHLPGAGVERCNMHLFTVGQANADGDALVAVMVRRMLYVGEHTVDCADPAPDGFPASCVLAMGALENYDLSGTAPVHFDPNGPVAPQSSFRLEVAADLLDYQAVTVTISEPGAGAEWHINQCVIHTEARLCGGGAIVDGDPARPQLMVSTDGSDITATILVRRVIETFDCGAEPETCSIVVESPATGTIHSVRLSFRPDAPLAEAAIFLEEPLRGEIDSQVWVQGRSPAQLRYPFLQCPAGSTGTDLCVPVGSPERLTAEGLVGTIRPMLVLSVGDGSATDCRQEGECVLRVVDVDASVAAEVPIVVIE